MKKSDIFVKSFDQLFNNIRQEVDQFVSGKKQRSDCSFLFFADESSESQFKELHVQSLVRDVDYAKYQQSQYFIGIKNISLNEKGTGQFTKFLEKLETLGYPIMIHDIINSRLDAFLEKRGYALFIEIKRYGMFEDEYIASRYFIPE